VGLELLVETARLWRSLGHHDMDGRFRIDGVTGPDEYSAVADNNVYTNLMARQNLRAAADAVARHPEAAEGLGVTAEEAASWRDAATAMVIPYDERLGVHPQSEGFTDYARWDFEGTRPDQYPLLLHFPYFDLYRKQVVKQADLVLAMHLRGDAFTSEEKERNFAYYEALTVRDSSLSACTQAVLAAELGHLELAHDYLGEAALVDLADLKHNTGDGLHMASLAGAWTGLVDGYGGMRTRGGRLSFAPWLPSAVGRLAFRVRYRGRCLSVTVEREEATYELIRGETMTIEHHGEELEVGDKPVTRPLPRPPSPPRPRQPAGRAPAPRVVAPEHRS
jgi:alpha,alpha-trehalose phosphorylase